MARCAATATPGACPAACRPMRSPRCPAPIAPPAPRRGSMRGRDRDDRSRGALPPSRESAGRDDGRRSSAARVRKPSRRRPVEIDEHAAARHLRHDQAGAQAAHRVRRSRAFALKHGGRVVVSNLEERHETTRDRDSGTHGRRRDGADEIRSEHEMLGILVEEERRNDVRRPHGQQHAERAAGHRDEDAVREQLPASWPRPAPSATRTDVSCERADARASRNDATLAHAMKNTAPAAARSSVPMRDMPPDASGVMPV